MPPDGLGDGVSQNCHLFVNGRPLSSVFGKNLYWRLGSNHVNHYPFKTSRHLYAQLLLCQLFLVMETLHHPHVSAQTTSVTISSKTHLSFKVQVLPYNLDLQPNPRKSSPFLNPETPVGRTFMSPRLARQRQEEVCP